MICPDLTAPTYLIISEDAPPLLYYSHIPTLVISLILGFFVYFKSKRSLTGKMLSAISVIFSLWILFNLIVWTSVNSDMVMFSWSFFGILYVLLSISCVYFTYVFVNKKNISIKIKLILELLCLPAIIFTPTRYNLGGFNLQLCGCTGFEEKYFTSYFFIIGLVAFFWILIFGICKYKT